jgi:heptose I phosphotransferase
MVLILDDKLAEVLPRDAPFDALLTLRGQVFREHRHRRTMRCLIGDAHYFVKIHGHTGWVEILKNVLRGRMPTLTALPEWRAIGHARELEVPTLEALGVGRRGWNPARLQSFLITRELAGMMHLDEAAGEWLTLPPRQQFRLRRAAVAELASIARVLHGNGLNHRDFYLCHFMLPRRNFGSLGRGEGLELHVIDLHRVQIRRRTPARWIAKDLSGLLFSSLDAGVTSLDALRFLRAYWGADWRSEFRGRPGFLRHIIRRAARLYRSEHGKPPRLPAGLASF